MANIDYQNGLAIGAACNNFYDTTPMPKNVVFKNDGQVYNRIYHKSNQGVLYPVDPAIPTGYGTFRGWKDSSGDPVSFPYNHKWKSDTLTSWFGPIRTSMITSSTDPLFRICVNGTWGDVQKFNSDDAYVAIYVIYNIYQENQIQEIDMVLISETQDGCKIQTNDVVNSNNVSGDLLNGSDSYMIYKGHTYYYKSGYIYNVSDYTSLVSPEQLITDKLNVSGGILSPVNVMSYCNGELDDYRWTTT